MELVNRVLETLLRTRGGISVLAKPVQVARSSSPHARRYFRLPALPGKYIPLFSARAEVFPFTGLARQVHSALLRTRGGISSLKTALDRCCVSSPHARRYFPVKLFYGPIAMLFSARAEVFPVMVYQHSGRDPLLRTRGGISLPSKPAADHHHSSPHARRYFR
ncbi:hypothetical protein SAMN05421878_1027 [Actinobaculum suis]|uniref:Uncharacterized protein n=1 Tax=Actinobaculum suis TaxID=1657 RepID=A0A1G6ZZH8_9ACTO|nr:hypothetical protein SAMN05421878_1027 [Actinobaculum suis]